MILNGGQSSDPTGKSSRDRRFVGLGLLFSALGLGIGAVAAYFAYQANSMARGAASTGEEALQVSPIDARIHVRPRIVFDLSRGEAILRNNGDLDAVDLELRFHVVALLDWKDWSISGRVTPRKSGAGLTKPDPTTESGGPDPLAKTESRPLTTMREAEPDLLSDVPPLVSPKSGRRSRYDRIARTTNGLTTSRSYDPLNLDDAV